MNLSGRQPENLQNQRFGRLKVLELATKSRDGSVRWLCICNCGGTKAVRAKTLKNGGTRSCGCLLLESWNTNRRTHGKSYTKVYYAWRNMLKRCFWKKGKDYPNYGGRGITVCSRWMKFENFFQDMGDPSPDQSLERMDGEENYTPENCIWADRTLQNRNKRNVRIIEFNGRALTLPEWSEVTGIKLRTLYSRIVEKGWSPERAFTKEIKCA